MDRIGNQRTALLNETRVCFISCNPFHLATILSLFSHPLSLQSPLPQSNCTVAILTYEDSEYYKSNHAHNYHHLQRDKICLVDQKRIRFGSTLSFSLNWIGFLFLARMRPGFIRIKI